MVSPTITGSRFLDLTVFCCIAVVMLALSPRLRVYYSVTVIEVEIVRVDPSGRREVLSTPTELRQIEEGYTGPSRIIAVLEHAADLQMARFALQRADPAGTRYEFAFRYGFDTVDLDQSYLVEREVRSDGS